MNIFKRVVYKITYCTSAFSKGTKTELKKMLAYFLLKT